MTLEEKIAQLKAKDLFWRLQAVSRLLEDLPEETRGALSTMAAYNSLDGIPCSCHKWLLTDVLRDEWTLFIVALGEGKIPRLQSSEPWGEDSILRLG